MTYIIINNGTITELSGQSFEIDDIQYPGNITALWPEEELNSLGIIRAPIKPNPPAGMEEESSFLELVNGTPTWNITYKNLSVPTKVHKFWLIKVLEGLGQMDDIEDAMDAAWEAGNRSLKRDWLAATEIERANQLVNEFAAARGFSSFQVDQMFIQAWAYQNANQN